MHTSTLTQKGQVTIPVYVRRKLGIKPKGKVFFEERGKEFVVRPVEDINKMVDSLYGSIKTDIKWNKKKAYEAVGKMLAARHLKTLK